MTEVVDTEEAREGGGGGAENDVGDPGNMVR